MRITLFVPCFNDAFYPQTGVALVRILERLGHEVRYPTGQTCCGQVHFNTGYRRDALRLLRRFVRVFEGAEVVVAPSASCVAMVREHYPVLAGESRDAALADAVSALGARTFEMTEFLVDRLGVKDLGASFRARVAFHPTCHSIRAIDVGQAPEHLLRAVEGLELVELPDARECCGFGGTFAVKNPEVSLAMLADKIEAIVDSGAEVLTAVDNSCLMHIAGGLHRRGFLTDPWGRFGAGPADPDEGHGAGSRVHRRRIRVMHLAEILAGPEESVP